MFAGLFIGVTSAAFLIFTNRDPLLGVSAGFWALCANFAVTLGGRLLTTSEASGFDQRPALTPLSEPESP